VPVRWRASKIEFAIRKNTFMARFSKARLMSKNLMSNSLISNGLMLNCFR